MTEQLVDHKFEYILPEADNKSAEVAVAVVKAAFEIIIGINNNDDVLNRVDEWAIQLQEQINELKLALEETRAEFATYMQDEVLTKLHSDILAVQESLDRWTHTKDPQDLRAPIPLMRSCYWRLHHYLLKTPGFISDEGYLRIEQLAMVNLSQQQVAFTALGGAENLIKGLPDFIGQLAIKASTHQRSSLESRHPDCTSGIRTVNDEPGAMIIAQDFGFIDQTGACRKVSTTTGRPFDFRTGAAQAQAEEARQRFIADRLNKARAPINEYYGVMLNLLSRAET